MLNIQISVIFVLKILFISENKFEQLADNGKFIEEDEEEEDDDFIASLRDIPQVNR